MRDGRWARSPVCTRQAICDHITATEHKKVVNHQPSSNTGTTGTLARRASICTPGLRSPRQPSVERVCSGKIATTCPSRNSPTNLLVAARLAASRAIGTIGHKAVSTR